MAALDQLLNVPLDAAGELSITDFFWHKDVPKSMINRYKPYLRYYSKEMRRAAQSGIRPEDRLLSRTAAKTHADLISIVKILSSNRYRSLAEMQDLVKSSFGNYDDRGRKTKASAKV